MNRIPGFALTYLDSQGTDVNNDSATPNIVKNIERMAKKYQRFIDTEISEELASQTEQAEKVKKLKQNNSRTSK